MQAADGKMRLTDVADNEQLFCLIQSIRLPNAELFKLFQARFHDGQEGIFPCVTRL